jgi:hypothetical protein
MLKRDFSIIKLNDKWYEIAVRLDLDLDGFAPSQRGGELERLGDVREPGIRRQAVIPSPTSVARDR